MWHIKLKSLSEKLVSILSKKSFTITAAESCTGGLFASFITSVSGSSKCFNGSFVTYSNEMKMAMINVDGAILSEHGAVSKECVEQMCIGAMAKTKADISVSISGVAGPLGGTKEKPVGTVYIAVLYDGIVEVSHNIFEGDRESVRYASVHKALDMVMDILQR